MQPHANVALGLTQDFFWIILTSIRNIGIFLPLDADKGANPGDDAAELVGHLPGGVEGADSARRKPGDGVAVTIFAEVVFGRDLGENFVAQKARIAVADGIVERAAHGIFQIALPLVAIGLHEIVSRSPPKPQNPILRKILISNSRFLI